MNLFKADLSVAGHPLVLRRRASPQSWPSFVRWRLRRPDHGYKIEPGAALYSSPSEVFTLAR